MIMNKKTKETIDYILNSPAMSLMIIVVLISSSILWNLSFCISNTIKKETIKLEQETKKGYYYLYEETDYNYDYIKIKLFNEKLKTSSLFDFYEINQQGIVVENIKSDIFIDTAHTNSGVVIKSARLSENVFADFNLEVEEGRIFTDEEYNLDMDSLANRVTIPVLAGYKYMDYYKLGDKITSTNCFIKDGVKFDLEIVGFLKKDLFLPSGQGGKMLYDDYLIMPSYNFISSTFDGLVPDGFWAYVKTNGVIVSSLDANQIESIISRLAGEVGIPSGIYKVIGADKVNSVYNDKNIIKIEEIFRKSSILAIVFSTTIMSIFMFIAIKRRLKYYAIIFTNGYVHSDLLDIISMYPFLLCLISYIIGSLLSLFLLVSFEIDISIKSFIFLALYYFMMCVVSSFIAYKKVINSDLSVYLRKR